MKFQSKREGERYLFLRSEQLAGRISDLRCQMAFELIPAIGKNRPTTYIADFVYKDKNGRLVVEDAKGVKTEVYRIKKKLMRYRYGIEVQEV